MNRSFCAPLAVVAIVIGLVCTSRSPSPAQPASAAHAADREAIAKSARDFADAFNAHDAKAVAALWTENGESRDADGSMVVGRAAIEKAFADAFKANPSGKVEVLVKSIRFPAKDLAVEEGLLRHGKGARDLPYTTSYVAIHAREGGSWRIALSSESGVGQNRLEDLDWLIGDWTGKFKDDAVKFSFVRDAKKPVMTASVARTAAGKAPVVAGIRIALDPETAQIRSWGFDDDGGHSQALWARDSKGWILDVRGVLADGTPTAERILLQRLGPDVITWRAIDRVVGETRLPDSPPARLTRTTASK
jgi:uncharacterized protein (TIGR02246 family)